MIKKLKKVIKTNLFLTQLVNKIFFREIINVNKTNYKKNALLSYSVYPFKNKRKRLIHSNYIEIEIINKILKENNYNVDVYNNNDNKIIDYKKYDLIIGEGLPIANYFIRKNNNKIKTLYYATGSHPWINNINSYMSVCQFYKKRKKLLLNSTRILDERWGIAASLAEKVIILGNKETLRTFQKFNQNIINIYPTFYSKYKIKNLTNKKKNKFLWFGSYSLVHKGLDNVLETFISRDDLELYVCGYLENEKELLECYSEELVGKKNIHLIGFISLESDKFRELLEECSFVILDSWAEGCSTGILTAMGNGGLIPIISKECGIDVNLGIEIKEHSNLSLKKALEESQKYTKEEIIKKSEQLIEAVQKQFCEEEFEVTLRKEIENFIKEDKHESSNSDNSMF